MNLTKYGSGTGNSYQSDWQKCQRFFLHKHRRGLTHRDKEKIIALSVGTAGHLWYEYFFKGFLEGLSYEQAMERADYYFWEGAKEAAQEVGDLVSWDTIREDEKMAFAQLVLKARARGEWEKLESGEERVLGVEWESYLMLPPVFNIPSSDENFFIRHTCGTTVLESENPALDKCRSLEVDCLRRYTVKIDLVKEHREKGVRTIDHKFSSASSPKQYAQEMLNNDQGTRYMYVWNEKMQPRALGIVFNVNRLSAKISASSFHEEYCPIDENQLTDSWMRLCLERAEMSEKWDKPMELWEARRWASGPCVRFGRDCEFKLLCDDPGREHSYISEHGGGGKYWLPAKGEAAQ